MSYLKQVRKKLETAKQVLSREEALVLSRTIDYANQTGGRADQKREIEEQLEFARRNPEIDNLPASEIAWMEKRLKATVRELNKAHKTIPQVLKLLVAGKTEAAHNALQKATVKKLSQAWLRKNAQLKAQRVAGR